MAPKTVGIWRILAGFFGLFAGLCTIFALIVTVAEAWQEHAQAQWPEVTARIQKCGLHPTSTGRRDRYYINCRLTYVVGAEEIVSNIYSRSVFSPNTASGLVFTRDADGNSIVTWQYPPNQIGPLQDWVDEHPQGTPIVVHYDPGNHKKAVLVTTDMPLAGPHTPSNLKILGTSAAACVVLLAIARITRRRPA